MQRLRVLILAFIISQSSLLSGAIAEGQYCNFSQSDTVITCFPYFWDQTDSTYFFSGVYRDTVFDMNGCDSVFTLDLTVYTSYIFNETAFICTGDVYVWNQRLLFEEGVYFDTLSTVNGCDSVKRLSLFVTQVDTAVNVFSDRLVASSNSGQYQWFDCNTGAAIAGANSRTFRPTNSGIYRLRVFENGCFSFSSCKNFLVTELKNPVLKNLILSPNPAQSHFNVQVPEGESLLKVQIYNMENRLVKEFFEPSGTAFEVQDLQAGIYSVQVITRSNSYIQKLMLIK